jgi:hypothetical protein
MASVSDRSLFLEAIKTEPMTISDIIHRFGVARNTARSWAGHSEVEQVIGSYPRQYRRKNSFAESAEIPKPKKVKAEDVNENTVRLPDVPKPALKNFFDNVMANEEAERFNFTEEFRQAESIEDLKSLENKVIASLVLTRYYQELMAEYEASFDS